MAGRPFLLCAHHPSVGRPWHVRHQGGQGKYSACALYRVPESQCTRNGARRRTRRAGHEWRSVHTRATGSAGYAGHERHEGGLDGLRGPGLCCTVLCTQSRVPKSASATTSSKASTAPASSTHSTSCSWHVNHPAFSFVPAPARPSHSLFTVSPVVCLRHLACNHHLDLLYLFSFSLPARSFHTASYHSTHPCHPGHAQTLSLSHKLFRKANSNELLIDRADHESHICHVGQRRQRA